ncbi:lysosomal membrane ascorbate-dependent ferrireductase CYB561A3-like [Clytia hemisphaerica]|uniref:Cytochrome b561 domain-containing protein n=1 Tax=Clytia hemisphaerica TaxID=252671 RepID=A0A7M5UR09_9CNID
METNFDDGNTSQASESKPITPPANTNSEQRNDGLFFALVLIFELLCILTIVLLVYWGHNFFGGYGWDGSGKMFNWHPLMMVLGMIVLYGNAAISYRVFNTAPKFQIKLLHAGLHGLALVFMIVGLVAVFGFHNHNNIPNLYSLHSWIGILTVTLFSAQYLLGFTAFLFPKFGDDLRAIALKYHQFFGRAILYLVVIASVSGLTEKMLFAHSADYKYFIPVGNIANVIGVVLAIMAMLVEYIVHEPTFKREEPYEPVPVYYGHD